MTVKRKKSTGHCVHLFGAGAAPVARVCGLGLQPAKRIAKMLATPGAVTRTSARKGKSGDTVSVCFPQGTSSVKCYG